MELPNRLDIERSFATRLLGLSTKQRNRIIALAGFPPDLTKIPQEEWDRIERENQEKLAAILLLIWLASAELHGADVSRGRIWLMGHELAQQHSITLASQINETTRTLLGRALATGQEITKATWAAVLDTVFGEDRAERIAVTETTTATVSAGEAVVTHSLNDTWFTVSDTAVCPICQPLHGVPRDVWAMKFPLGPPAHPVCRCWIQYEGMKA